MTPRRYLALGLACLLAFMLTAAYVRVQTHRMADLSPQIAALATEIHEANQNLAGVTERLQVTAAVLGAFKEHGLDPDLGLSLLADCDEYGLDPVLALKVIAVESGFDPRAVHVNAGGSRDWGLMQLNDNTWPWLASELGIKRPDPLDARQNMAMGVYYLAMLVKRLGTEAGLVAYNQGPRGVSRGDSSRYTTAVLGADAGK